jgi:hypothetical protein
MKMQAELARISAQRALCALCSFPDTHPGGFAKTGGKLLFLNEDMN